MRAPSRSRGPLALITTACLLTGGAVTACQTSTTTHSTQVLTTDSATPRDIGRQAARQLTAPPTPRLTEPTPLPTPDRPPAPLPPWPTRAQAVRWTCDRILREVNGGAARCVPQGSPALHAQAVAGGEQTVGLTDEDQVVYVQRGMSPEDTYVVAMHERGHQELRQRCDTWTCGDVILRALHLTRPQWAEGSYFDRAVEIAASTWARCHGADNPRYGYRLSCRDLQRAFDAESAARRRYSDQQDAYTAAWQEYRDAFSRYSAQLASPTPERTP